VATQARLTAAQMAQKVQTGTKGAAEQFNKFVEDSGSGNGSKGASRSTAEPERKDFWDSFGGSASEQQGVSNKMSSGGKPSAIGTAAMKKGVKDKGGDDDKWEEF
jgi:ADP-ribosylation factor GTPase-activating protein 1